MAEVQGMEDVRRSLPSILATFREAPQSEPVHFGSHRRDEAVLLSKAQYDRQLAAERELEELERLGALAMVRDRLSEERFSEGTVDELFASLDDET